MYLYYIEDRVMIWLHFIRVLLSAKRQMARYSDLLMIEVTIEAKEIYQSSTKINF